AGVVFTSGLRRCASRSRPGQNRVGIGQIAVKFLLVAMTFAVNQTLRISDLHESAGGTIRLGPSIHGKFSRRSALTIQYVIETGHRMHFAVVDVNRREEKLGSGGARKRKCHW